MRVSKKLQTSERRAVIIAQELAAGLQNETSQATTACNSWKIEVKRRKRWRCKSRREKQGEASCITHLFLRTSIKKPGCQTQFCRRALRQKDREKSTWKRSSSSGFQKQKEEIVVTIENVTVGISRISNASRKINVIWERIVHSFTLNRGSDLPVLNKKKEKQMSPKKE